jgi:hypothetical protein
VEVPAEAAQAAAPAGDLQAEVVELSDDSPPPGWNQWASWPTNFPEPQEGALVRRHEGHMVVGGRGHGAEASSSHAGRPAQVGGPWRIPLRSLTPGGSRSSGASFGATAPRSTAR